MLTGEINDKGKATGYHSESAADGASRIKPGAEIQYNADGTYKAPVQIYDANKGQWVDKFANSTFFDPSWSKAKINYEVSEAFKNRVEAPSGNGWQGTTPSGVKVQFYWDAKNQRTTFYPLGDK